MIIANQLYGTCVAKDKHPDDRLINAHQDLTKSSL